MAEGKKTGGRAKGTPNRATAAIAEEIAASGLTPLQHMLSVMRDELAPDDRRDDMARAAAPYVHAKLSSVEVGGPGGGDINITISPKDAEL